MLRVIKITFLKQCILTICIWLPRQQRYRITTVTCIVYVARNMIRMLQGTIADHRRPCLKSCSCAVQQNTMSSCASLISDTIDMTNYYSTPAHCG